MISSRMLILMRCASRCVICKVHSTLIVNISNNMQPLNSDLVVLCSDCNNLFGSSPKKWKKIKLMKSWLENLVSIQESVEPLINSKGFQYSIVSKDIRNYLVNCNIIIPMLPNRSDPLKAFKYVLKNKVEEVRSKYPDANNIALLIELFEFGMSKKQKRDYQRYFRGEIIDEYLHVFQELHLPEQSIIRVDSP